MGAICYLSRHILPAADPFSAQWHSFKCTQPWDNGMNAFFFVFSFELVKTILVFTAVDLEGIH